MRCIEPRQWLALAMAGLLLAAPALASAQQGGGQDPAAGERLGQEELAAFARAARAVHTIRKGESAPVAAAVRQRMVAAVKEQGLTLERYNAIARRIRQEEDLYARYQEAWNGQKGG